MTTNYDPEDSVRRARGLTGSFAGGAQVIVDDGVTEVDAFQITIAGGVVTEPADGIAQITFGGGTGPPAGDLGAVGSAATLDLSLYHVFVITLTANLTLTFSNPPVSGVEGEWYVVFIQGGSGSYTVAWPGAVTWQDVDGTDGGPAPTLFTAVGAEDVIVLTTIDGGVSYGGAQERQGLIVKDEGTALATAAWAIDFVGAGVTASGTGASKTITIPGGGAPSGAAGGDLSGTYPNPSVVDDSHSHTASTLPAGLGTTFIVIGQEERTSDGSTVAWALDNDFEESSVSARNLTTGHNLSVTETLPNTATISAAGTAGDIIAFAYAASVAA